MKDSGLKQVAGTLAKGQAGLIVVYAANMSEQINAAIKAENKYVSEELNVGQAVLDKQIATDASGAEPPRHECCRAGPPGRQCRC